MINGRDKGFVILIVTICAIWAHEVFSYVNYIGFDIGNNFNNGDCCYKIGVGFS